MSRNNDKTPAPAADAAFLGRRLARLLDLLDTQHQAEFDRMGLTIPVRSSSIVLLLSATPHSLVQLARKLGLPHQLVAQRMEILLNREIVVRAPDPGDRRRSLFELTPEGMRQLEVLSGYRSAVAGANEDLYRQLGVRLDEVIDQTCSLLVEEPLAQRLKRLGAPSPKAGRAARPGR